MPCALIRRELDGRVPLIGFAGSPWTVGDLHRRGRQLARVLAHQGDDVRGARDAAFAARAARRVDAAVLERADRRRCSGGDDLRHLGRRADAARSIASSRCSYMQRIVDGLHARARRSPRAGHSVHQGRRCLARRNGADRLRCARRRLDDGSRRCAPRRARPRRAAGQSRPELPVCLAAERFATRSRACSRATATATATCSISATAFIPPSTPEHAGAMIAAVHELSPPITRDRHVAAGRASAWLFFSSSRSSRRRILPTFVFGSSFLKYTCRGTL